MELDAMIYAAKKAEEAGAFDEAIEWYEELARASRTDGQWPRSAAMLHRRLGRLPEFAASMGRAARRYAQAGFTLKAVVALRAILEVLPDHVEARQALSQLERSAAAVEPPVPPPAPGLAAHIRASLAPPAFSFESTPEVEVPRTPLAPSPLMAAPVPPPNPAPIAPPAALPAYGGVLSPFGFAPPAALPVMPTAPGLPMTPASAFGPAPHLRAALVPPAPDPRALPFAVPVRMAPAPAPRSATPAPWAAPPLEDEPLSVDEPFAPPPSLPRAGPRLPSEIGFAPPPGTAAERIPLLSSLAPDQVRLLLESSSTFDVEAETTLFRDGDPSDVLYLVVEGRVRITQGASVTELGDGEMFGEFALFTDRPRAASAVAATPSTLLAVPRRALTELAERSPEVIAHFLAFLRDRMAAQVLRGHPRLGRLSDEQRAELVERFHVLEVEAASPLIEAGLPSPGMFVLIHGSIAARHRQGRRLSTVRYVRPGEVFGEVAIDGGLAAETYATAENCIVLMLSSLDAQRMLRHEAFPTAPPVAEPAPAVFV